VTTETVQVPAGWYPDPTSLTESGMPTQRRWWDGTSWSRHTAPFETTLPSTPSTSAASIALPIGGAPTTVGPGDSARVAEKMPLHSVGDGARRAQTRTSTYIAAAAPYSALSPATSTSVSSVGSVADYEPFAHRRHADRRTAGATQGTMRNPLALRVHTVSIWLIATMPVTQAMLIYWVFSSLPPESSAWTRALTVALPVVLYSALAGQDTHQLENSGHLRTAPWILALVAPPLFLAVRGVRVYRATGAAPWPLVVWTVVQVSVIAVWWALDPGAVQSILQSVS
jgi:hypothetical protein